jgi:hypothetical protein
MPVDFCLCCGCLPPCRCDPKKVRDLAERERTHFAEYQAASSLTSLDFMAWVRTEEGTVPALEFFKHLRHPGAIRECPVKRTAQGLIQLVYCVGVGSHLLKWEWGRAETNVPPTASAVAHAAPAQRRSLDNQTHEHGSIKRNPRGAISWPRLSRQASKRCRTVREVGADVPARPGNSLAPVGITLHCAVGMQRPAGFGSQAHRAGDRRPGGASGRILKRYVWESPERPALFAPVRGRSGAIR